MLQTALGSREFQFARQASLIWLASYPGDLLINFIYANILAELSIIEMAKANLEKILGYDPEFTEAVSLLDQRYSPNVDGLAKPTCSAAVLPLPAERNGWRSSDRGAQRL